jgi:hypothetical protein
MGVETTIVRFAVSLWRGSTWITKASIDDEELDSFILRFLRQHDVGVPLSEKQSAQLDWELENFGDHRSVIAGRAVAKWIADHDLVDRCDKLTKEQLVKCLRQPLLDVLTASTLPQSAIDRAILMATVKVPELTAVKSAAPAAPVTVDRVAAGRAAAAAARQRLADQETHARSMRK